MTEQSLNEGQVRSNPIEQFALWYEEAQQAHLPEPDAMTLATATRDGRPSARMVLLKGFDERGFVFYTNYQSGKGRVIEANPRAALILFWAELHRQIRIEGTVAHVSDAESDAYFRSRPKGSRIAALASNQSEVLENRDQLDARVAELTQKYGAGDGVGDDDVPRPAHWGGYRVVPETIEFWQGRRDRLHDRLLFTRRSDGAWSMTRLFP
ncbi:MAG TPA: pyridoxamine 5'-phosphate oxidase [Chloroflexota bacterium]|jgi:pyridoxamine 5'-phosphate oxidase